MSFRAGDVVRIDSIGESWVLAADERNGEVVCAGWPESMIKASLCVLEEAATDSERTDMLTNVARSCADQMRGRWAADDLARGPDNKETGNG